MFTRRFSGSARPRRPTGHPRYGGRHILGGIAIALILLLTAPTATPPGT